MFRLNVNVSILTDASLTDKVRKAAESCRLEDIIISCSEGVPDAEKLDYKHICILITDEEDRLASIDSEYLFTIFIGNSLPHDKEKITEIISPAPADEYFIFQMEKMLEGVINSYMFWFFWSMMETTFNATPDLIWYKALDGTHFNVNDSFCYTVSKTKSDIEDRKHAYIWGVSEDEAFACQESEEETLRADKTCSFEEKVATPDGLKTMVTYKTPLRTIKGTVIGTAGIAQDVTKQREYEARLQQMALTDSLSGLYNRRSLYQMADEKYPGAKTVVYVDIDYFKIINDTYGHEKGDDILRLVSSELQEKFSDGIIARIGGDEFVIVLEENFSDESISSKFGEIDVSFATAKEAEGIKVQLSHGRYRSELPIEDAIREADELMYEDKRRHHEADALIDRSK